MPLQTYTSKVGADKREHIFLSAEDCYALRCSFLHEGVSNIEEQKARKALDDFHFITPVKGMYIHCNQSGKSLQLQVDVFCNQMADAVDEWALSISTNIEMQERISGLIVIHDSSNGVSF